MANPRKAKRPRQLTPRDGPNPLKELMKKKGYSVHWTRQLWSELPTTLQRNQAIETRAGEIMKQKPLGPFIELAEAKKIAFRQIRQEMGGYPAKAPFSSP